MDDYIDLWKADLINRLDDLDDNTQDHPECPCCGATMNFFGHDKHGDWDYGEGYWECPACNWSITEADLDL